MRKPCYEVEENEDDVQYINQNICPEVQLVHNITKENIL